MGTVKYVFQSNRNPNEPLAMKAPPPLMQSPLKQTLRGPKVLVNPHYKGTLKTQQECKFVLENILFYSSLLRVRILPEGTNIGKIRNVAVFPMCF